jgi:hypothetical protein
MDITLEDHPFVDPFSLIFSMCLREQRATLHTVEGETAVISIQQMKRMFILRQNFTLRPTIHWPVRIAAEESPQANSLSLGAFYHPGHLEFIRYLSISSASGISGKKLRL